MYFSSVRTVRPGKHFLIETEDGGGELEDAPANNGAPITSRLEKCEKGKTWHEDDGKGEILQTTLEYF